MAHLDLKLANVCVRFRGAGLEVKLGARITEAPDGLEIEGDARLRGACVQSGGDHRMAMALVVAGLVAEGETIVEDTECIGTSYPGFVETVNALAGAPCVEELP